MGCKVGAGLGSGTDIGVGAGLGLGLGTRDVAGKVGDERTGSKGEGGEEEEICG